MTVRRWGVLFAVLAMAATVGLVVIVSGAQPAVPATPFGAVTAQWDLINGTPTTTVVAILYATPDGKVLVRYAAIKVPERLVPRDADDEDADAQTARVE